MSNAKAGKQHKRSTATDWISSDLSQEKDNTTIKMTKVEKRKAFQSIKVWYDNAEERSQNTTGSNVTACITTKGILKPVVQGCSPMIEARITSADMPQPWLYKTTVLTATIQPNKTTQSQETGLYLQKDRLTTGTPK